MLTRQEEIPARAAQIKKLSLLAAEFDNATVLAAIQDYYNKPDLSYSDWQHDLIVRLIREAAC